jgi:hypothetical protein
MDVLNYSDILPRSCSVGVYRGSVGFGSFYVNIARKSRRAVSALWWGIKQGYG